MKKAREGYRWLKELQKGQENIRTAERKQKKRRKLNTGLLVTQQVTSLANIVALFEEKIDRRKPGNRS